MHPENSSMLNEMETVIFLKAGKEHSGAVIGCEKDYFWLLVSDLKCVYVGHPDRVFEIEGKKYFEVFDHCQPTDKMINASGEAESYLFEYSRNPERIIKLLKTHRLIGAA